MMELTEKIVAALLTALLACIGTVKMTGAVQQSGYKNGTFMRWLRRKDNLYYNRLSVLALCLALASAVTALCFSFLGATGALLVSALPFFVLWAFFVWADGKYALKVPVNKTGRWQRLFAVYYLFVACTAYILIAVLGFLADWNGSETYALIAYVPFAALPLLLPFLLAAANGVTGVFENARNKKFVKKAERTLRETEIVRVGVVGSYGKTSVKNILKTILSEKYAVVETPASFNTPIGIAKTATSAEFAEKQVFIAEMGARKRGDIKELCELVKPDYAVFTGVCEQHIATFGSLEEVFEEKSEILRCGAKKVICGESLKAFLGEDYADRGDITVADGGSIENLRLGATETAFELKLGEDTVAVKTELISEAAAENILLAALLCKEMGMTAAEIVAGIGKLKAVPHRLQLLESGGVYILDDGYNCNPRGAKAAIEALKRFGGRKCIVTPGIVECGILEEQVNGELGAEIAAAGIDLVILVGETLVGAVKRGYERADGESARLCVVQTLTRAQAKLAEWLEAGDAVLFLNDLPDVY